VSCVRFRHSSTSRRMTIRSTFSDPTVHSAHRIGLVVRYEAGSDQMSSEHIGEEPRSLTPFRLEKIWRIDLRATVSDCIRQQRTAPGLSG
jgi:hypothetical protein